MIGRTVQRPDLQLITEFEVFGAQLGEALTGEHGVCGQCGKKAGFIYRVEAGKQALRQLPQRWQVLTGGVAAEQGITFSSAGQAHGRFKVGRHGWVIQIKLYR